MRYTPLYQMLLGLVLIADAVMWNSMITGHGISFVSLILFFFGHVIALRAYSFLEKPSDGKMHPDPLEQKKEAESASEHQAAEEAPSPSESQEDASEKEP